MGFRFGPMALLLVAIGCQAVRAEFEADSVIGDLPPVNYSNPSVNQADYHADSKFQVAWYLQWLYRLTDAYIDLMAPRQALPEGSVYVDENREIQVTWVHNTMGHYGVILTVSIICMLIALIVPIIGFCLCCCSGIGCHGSSSIDKPRDVDSLRCRRNVYGTLVFFIGAFLIIGVLTSTLSNAELDKGTRQLPESLETILKDLKLYFQNVLVELDTLLGKNFHELSDSLMDLLNKTGVFVIDKLGEMSDAVALADLSNVVTGLNDITADLKSIDEHTGYLKANATKLDTSLNSIRTNLETTFDQCGKPCDPIKEEIKVDEISVAAELDKLPTEEINQASTSITELINSGIVEKVQKGQKEFEGIKKLVQDKVDELIPKMTTNIEKSAAWLEKTTTNARNITDKSINRFVDDTCVPLLHNASSLIDKYAPYRLGTSVAISFIVAVVAICLLLGLICSLCDKQAGSISKIGGSTFLAAAVWVIFLVSTLLIIFNVYLMIAGVLSDRWVCEPLERPRDNRIIGVFNQILEIKDNSLGFEFPQIKLEEIIEACEANKPITQALSLDKVIDAESWDKLIEKFDIKQTMQEIVDEIKIGKDYVFIDDVMKKELYKLVDSGIGSIDFSLYTELLAQQITGVDLGQLASQLNGFAGVEGLPADVKEALTKNAEELNNCQTTYIEPMKISVSQLATTAGELENHIKFNHTSMKEAIDDMIKKAEDAQTTVNGKGSELVKTIATDFTTSLVSLITGYVDHAHNRIMNEMAKCKPLSNVFKATLVSTCDKILNPYNAFWFSIGWCLIFFIPAIIFSIKLNTAQRRFHAYSSSSAIMNPLGRQHSGYVPGRHERY